MKKIILSSSFLLLSLTGFGQSPTTTKIVGTATTQEEYNYATKGLKTQRAQGLDMKAGYILDNKTSLPIGGTTIVIEDLIRKGDQTLACIVVQVMGQKQSNPVYLAIPNPATGGDIFGQYAKAIADLEPALAKPVLYSMSARLSSMESIAVKLAQ